MEPLAPLVLFLLGLIIVHILQRLKRPGLAETLKSIARTSQNKQGSTHAPERTPEPPRRANPLTDLHKAQALMTPGQDHQTRQNAIQLALYRPSDLRRAVVLVAVLDECPGRAAPGAVATQSDRY
ncbi:MAG: hypothetical protein RL322_1784 [Pseudomonadota bacterium]|jgi:hypothetical protein